MPVGFGSVSLSCGFCFLGVSVRSVRELVVGLMQNGNQSKVWLRSSGGGGDGIGKLVTAVAIKLHRKIFTPQVSCTAKQQAFWGRSQVQRDTTVENVYYYGGP